MRSDLRALACLALAAIGAATANAQYASSYETGYASASFYNYQGSGMYITGSGGQYPVFQAPYSYGNAGNADYYYGVTVNPDMSGVDGSSWATAVPGGSYGIVNSDYNYSWVTITNTSSSVQQEFVDAITFGYASAYASSWNAYAASYGSASITDLNNWILQYQNVDASVLGLGLGGDSWSVNGYDTINGAFSYSAFYGNQFPYTVRASYVDAEWYTLTFQPGQSDTFYMAGYGGHVAYAITPAPCALAPFALGLIGAIRRCRKAPVE